MFAKKGKLFFKRLLLKRKENFLVFCRSRLGFSRPCHLVTNKMYTQHDMQDSRKNQKSQRHRVQNGLFSKAKYGFIPNKSCTVQLQRYRFKKWPEYHIFKHRKRIRQGKPQIPDNHTCEPRNKRTLLNWIKSFLEDRRRVIGDRSTARVSCRTTNILRKSYIAVQNICWRHHRWNPADTPHWRSTSNTELRTDVKSGEYIWTIENCIFVWGYEMKYSNITGRPIRLCHSWEIHLVCKTISNGKNCTHPM